LLTIARRADVRLTLEDIAAWCDCRAVDDPSHRAPRAAADAGIFRRNAKSADGQFMIADHEHILLSRASGYSMAWREKPPFEASSATTREAYVLLRTVCGRAGGAAGEAAVDGRGDQRSARGSDPLLSVRAVSPGSAPHGAGIRVELAGRIRGLSSAAWA
jgi:hypothetical protein